MTDLITIDEAKTLYQGEWIAFQTREDGHDPKGQVVFHHKDRSTFDREIIERKLTDVYITFAGPLVREGFSILFLIGDKHANAD